MYRNRYSIHVEPELPGEAIGPLYTTDGTLLIFVPTNLHEPISNPYTEGRSRSTLAWRGSGRLAEIEKTP
jgi:hypothetical protein